MSLSGMTGFARSEGAHGDWTWAVEARSVNGRNLDVRFRGPPGFDALERLAREAAQSRFQRGQVTISLQGRATTKAGVGRIDLAAADAYLRAGEALVAQGRATAPTLDGLLGLPGVLEPVTVDEATGERALVEVAMGGSVVQALDALRSARREEGAVLASLLNGFLDSIETLLHTAAAEAADQPAMIRDRFARRLTELAGEAASAERIVQEAAVIALKADVREELDRLASHVTMARGLLTQDLSTGRRLDFLSQEFMREANTLCAKSASSPLTAIGLELKATIDQLREQVQNVE